VNLVLVLTHQTGVRLAEIGFLLILIAGVWLVAAQIPAFKFARARTIVAGVLPGLVNYRRECVLGRRRRRAVAGWVDR